MAPQQSHGSNSRFSSALASRMRLAAIHQSPNSLMTLSPNRSGSAAPARTWSQAWPATRNWSRGTSVTSKLIGNQPRWMSSIWASISTQRACSRFQYSHTQWSSNTPVPK